MIFMKRSLSQSALIGLFMAGALAGYGQDLHFSQYTEMPSSINPALAGSMYNTRIIANFRSQWSSLGTPYQTIGLAFDQTIKFRKLRNNYFAFALNVFRDQAGDAKLTTLNPNMGLSFHQRVVGLT